MAENIGVEVKISGDEKKLRQALKRSEKATAKVKSAAQKNIAKGVAKSAAKAASAVEKMSSTLNKAKNILLGFAAIKVFGGLIGQLVSLNREIKELDTFSRTLGVSVNQLQAFGFAVKSVGFNTEKMLDILKDVQDKFGDAFGTGGGAAANDLNDLGISVEKFIKLNPVEKLVKLAEVTERMSKAKRVFVFESIANDASKLIPLLDNSGAKLQAFAKEVDELGLAFTKRQVENAKVFSAGVNRMTTLWSTFTQMLAAELAPAFDPLFKMVTDFVKKSGGVRQITILMAKTAVRFAVIFLNGLDAAQKGIRQFIIYSQTQFNKFILAINGLVATVVKGIDSIPGIDMTDSLAEFDRVDRESRRLIGSLEKRFMAIGKEANIFSGAITSLRQFAGRIGTDNELANDVFEVLDATRALTNTEKTRQKELEKAEQKQQKDMEKKKTALEKLKSLYDQNKQAALGLAEVEQGGGLIKQLQDAAKKSSGIVNTVESSRNRQILEAGLQFLRGGGQTGSGKEGRIVLELQVDNNGIIKPIVKSNEFEREVQVLINNHAAAQSTINDR